MLSQGAASIRSSISPSRQWERTINSRAIPHQNERTRLIMVWRTVGRSTGDPGGLNERPSRWRGRLLCSQRSAREPQTRGCEWTFPSFSSSSSSSSSHLLGIIIVIVFVSLRKHSTNELTMQWPRKVCFRLLSLLSSSLDRPRCDCSLPSFLPSCLPLSKVLPLSIRARAGGCDEPGTGRIIQILIVLSIFTSRTLVRRSYPSSCDMPRPCLRKDVFASMSPSWFLP